MKEGTGSLPRAWYHEHEARRKLEVAGLSGLSREMKISLPTAISNL